MIIQTLLLLVTSHLSQNMKGFDQPRLKKLGSQMDEMARKSVVAGSVSLLMRSGEVIFNHATGMSDVEAGSKMQTNTIFQVMSMTKPVTATAVLICVEEGWISLDDPIEKYLSEFTNVQVKTEAGTVSPLLRKPTIRHLLNHTSGLGSNDPGGLSDDDKFKMDLSTYGKLIGTDPLMSQPGEVIRYSGVGYSALASIVQKVSGARFESFVENRIFKPLEMSETTFFLPKEQRSRLAQVYAGEIGKLTPFAHDRFREGARFPNGAGGLYSTALDMGRFISDFLGKKNVVLSLASKRLMASLQTGQLQMDGNDARGFGLGWSVVRNSSGQSTLRGLGSFGHTGAFGTEFWAESSTGVVGVFMAQTFGLPEDCRKAFTTMAHAAIIDR